MRLKKLKRNLKKEEKFPYLISDLFNIKYLTGFNGSFAFLVVDEKKSYFISDTRYEEYAQSILPKDVEFVLLEKDLFNTLKKLFKSKGIKQVFLEVHSLALSTYLAMKKNLKGIKLVPGGDVVNEMRMAKEDSEIEILREAAKITDKCVSFLIDFIKPGMLEWDISTEIEYFYKKNGCQSTSFKSIVASGSGASMPHYETSMTKKIKSGEMLLIDMGCIYKGYNSDLTRTIFLGSIDPLFEEIYKIVLEAEESAIRAVKPGITVGKLDSIARGIISDKGYGENFGHALGHGFGLEVHEMPSVRKGDLKLKKNMTITIEPGIYIPGKGGVRIEDMVLVTGKGFEIMTGSSKDIIII